MESVLNTTSEQQLTSMVDISLLAVIVELLTNEAITNPKVCCHHIIIVNRSSIHYYYILFIDQGWLPKSYRLFSNVGPSPIKKIAK